MRGPLRIAAVVLLSCSLGLHWAALQSVAWTSMFLQRVRTASVGEALQSTFDGRHPCPICQAVRAGRDAERQATGTPASGRAADSRLELMSVSGPLVLVFDPGRRVPPVAVSVLLPLRSDPPPIPPPRSA